MTTPVMRPDDRIRRGREEGLKAQVIMVVEVLRLGLDQVLWILDGMSDTYRFQTAVIPDSDLRILTAEQSLHWHVHQLRQDGASHLEVAELFDRLAAAYRRSSKTKPTKAQLTVCPQVGAPRPA